MVESKKSPKTKFCVNCNKRVKVLTKAFGTLVCEKCNTIIDSDISIAKVCR